MPNKTPVVEIKLVQDTDPTSPRDWDNLATFYMPHRRYTLGDKDATDPRDPDRPGEYLPEIALTVELGMLDHSGLYLYAGGGSHPQDPGGWDSGTVGVAYVTKTKLREEYGRKWHTPECMERARQVILAEIETYSQYLRGDVYGFQLLDAYGGVVDSCWGFYGDDPKTNGMIEHWDDETRKVFEVQGFTD